jgi:hypothetical protein
MKNILAENLLRFGVKNLNDDNVHTLKHTSLILNEYVNSTVELKDHPDVKAMRNIITADIKALKYDLVDAANRNYEYGGTDLYIYSPGEAKQAGDHVAINYTRSLRLFTIGSSTYGMPCWVELPMVWYSMDLNTKVVAKGQFVTGDAKPTKLPTPGPISNRDYDNTDLQWRNAGMSMSNTTAVMEFADKFAAANANMWNGFYVRNKENLDQQKGPAPLQKIFDVLAAGGGTTPTPTTPVKKP